MKLASKTYPAQSLATRYEPTFYIPSIPGHTQLNGCSTDAGRFCCHKVKLSCEVFTRVLANVGART